MAAPRRLVYTSESRPHSTHCRPGTPSPWGYRMKRLIVLLSVVAFPVGALAQDEDSQSSEPIDEITVYGEQSLIHLQNEVNFAQESMFEVFNTLNTNDSFEVECRYQTRLDTRRRYLACVPKFMRLPPARIGSGYSYVRNGEDDPLAISPYATKMNRQFWAEMAKLIGENPELQKEYERLATLNAALESEREKRRAE